MLRLLYECDKWWSNDSKVLDGIFTNDDSLGVSLWELIRSHKDEHVSGGDLDEDDDFDEFVEDTINTLFSDGMTHGLSVNYLLEEVEGDRLL